MEGLTSGVVEEGSRVVDSREVGIMDIAMEDGEGEVGVGTRLIRLGDSFRNRDVER